MGDGGSADVTTHLGSSRRTKWTMSLSQTRESSGIPVKTNMTIAEQNDSFYGSCTNQVVALCIWRKMQPKLTTSLVVADGGKTENRLIWSVFVVLKKTLGRGTGSDMVNGKYGFNVGKRWHTTGMNDWLLINVSEIWCQSPSRYFF